MDDQALTVDLAAREDLAEQMAGQAGILLARDHPSDHVATEQVQDDVEVQVKASGQGPSPGSIAGNTPLIEKDPRKPGW